MRVPTDGPMGVTAALQGYEPEWNPLYRLGRHAITHWPEYLELLQDPSIYAGVAVAGGVGYAGALAGRKAAGHVLEKPGDIVLGRRVQKGRDAFLRKNVVARWPDRTHHSVVEGPTGSGKTTALLPMAVQDLLAGHTVMTEEIYGDFGTSLIPYAIAMGKPFLIFDPSVEGSLGWNPLSGEDDDAVVGSFASTVESLIGRHPFYGPLAGDASRAFARLAREWANLKGTEADLALFELLLTDADFLGRVLDVRDGEPRGGMRTEKVGARWPSRKTRSWFDSEYLRWADRTRVENLAGLKNWVRKLLATGAARRSLCPRPGDLVLNLASAIATGGILIVIRVPVEAVNEEPAVAMTRFFTRTVQNLTLRRRASYWPVPPLSLILDEFPVLVGRGTGEAEAAGQWLALVRKNNVSVTATHQGGALLDDVLLGALDANARTKLYAPGLGAGDARRAEQTLGYEEKEVHDERVTRAAPLSLFPGSYSQGTRTREAPRFGDDELRFAHIGEWIHLPFRNRRQHPPERLRMQRVPPPEAFAPRGSTRRKAPPRSAGGATGAAEKARRREEGSTEQA